MGVFEIPWDYVSFTTSSTENHTVWSVLNIKSELIRSKYLLPNIMNLAIMPFLFFFHLVKTAQ